MFLSRQNILNMQSIILIFSRIQSIQVLALETGSVTSVLQVALRIINSLFLHFMFLCFLANSGTSNTNCQGPTPVGSSLWECMCSTSYMSTSSRNGTELRWEEKDTDLGESIQARLLPFSPHLKLRDC